VAKALAAFNELTIEVKLAATRKTKPSACPICLGFFDRGSLFTANGIWVRRCAPKES
jgi:hypothetical protein